MDIQTNREGAWKRAYLIGWVNILVVIVPSPDTSTNSPGDTDPNANGSSNDEQNDGYTKPHFLLLIHVGHDIPPTTLPPFPLLLPVH